MLRDSLFHLQLRLACFAALYFLSLVVLYRLGLAGGMVLAGVGTASVLLMIGSLLFAVLMRRRRRVDRQLVPMVASGALLLLTGAMYSAPAAHMLFASFVFSGLAAAAHRLSRSSAITIGLAAACAYILAASLLYWESRNASLVQMQVLHFLTALLVLPGFMVLTTRLYNLGSALRDASNTLHDIKEDARRDHLTGCYNRRYTVAVLERQKRIADETASPLCLAVLDLDRFKMVNDELGHLAGDHVLQTFAMLAATSMRQGDVFGRYGGEEFLLVLPHTPLLNAKSVVERIRSQVENHVWTHGNGRSWKRRITVSIGVTQYIPGESVLDLFARADNAMYLAKNGGRNQVVAEEPVNR